MTVDCLSAPFKGESGQAALSVRVPGSSASLTIDRPPCTLDFDRSHRHAKHGGHLRVIELLHIREQQRPTEVLWNCAERAEAGAV